MPGILIGMACELGIVPLVCNFFSQATATPSTKKIWLVCIIYVETVIVAEDVELWNNAL